MAGLGGVLTALAATVPPLPRVLVAPGGAFRYAVNDHYFAQGPVEPLRQVGVSVGAIAGVGSADGSSATWAALAFHCHGEGTALAQLERAAFQVTRVRALRTALPLRGQGLGPALALDRGANLNVVALL